MGMTVTTASASDTRKVIVRTRPVVGAVAAAQSPSAPPPHVGPCGRQRPLLSHLR